MFRVGDVVVGGDKVVLIAEVGVNHLNDLELADRLVAAAARAGAQIVKFQTYAAERLVTRDAPRYWSWSGEDMPTGGQFESFKRLESPDETFTRALQQICRSHGVEFMATPFDTEAVAMLLRVGAGAFKVASGDITNLPLLRAVGAAELPVFLSSGASDLAEIEAAVRVLEAVGAPHVSVMHCTLAYPTRPEDANLTAINDLRATFPDRVLGFSDHTLGPHIGASSVLLGVDVIEKHFTVDRTLPYSADHWLSADEEEFRLMRSIVDVVRMARGIGRKTVLQAERAARENARRSLVTLGAVEKGAVFTAENIIAKRPATGISPMYLDEVLGLTAAEDLADDTALRPENVVGEASFKPITEATAHLFRP